MSSRDLEIKNSSIVEDSFEDSPYGDDLALDLEMEQIIKQLDAVTAEPLPAPLPLPPVRPKAPPKPVLTARPALPVEDELFSDVNEILLTERLGPVKEPPRQEVIDLVDKVEPKVEKDPWLAQSSEPVKPQIRRLTVAELTPEQLQDIIGQAVEGALRRFYGSK
jgi:hypothetical protein